MPWLLEKCCYEIADKTGNNNKGPLVADLILLSIYTILSIINATISWIPDAVWSVLKVKPGNTNPTIIVILINFIVLIRLNLSLYIKAKRNEAAVLEEFRKERRVVPELKIDTWMIRMWIVAVGYVIDVVVGLMCAAYGAHLIKALSFIVLVTIVETFLNSLIDNAEIRFSAKPKIYIQVKENGL